MCQLNHLEFSFVMLVHQPTVCQLQMTLEIFFLFMEILLVCIVYVHCHVQHLVETVVLFVFCIAKSFIRKGTNYPPSEWSDLADYVMLFSFHPSVCPSVCPSVRTQYLLPKLNRLRFEPRTSALQSNVLTTTLQWLRGIMTFTSP